MSAVFALPFPRTMWFAENFKDFSIVVEVRSHLGFREGKLRKTLWNSRGKWADAYIYSILRGEWKEPKVLTKQRN